MKWTMGFEYEVVSPISRLALSRRVKKIHSGIKVVDDCSVETNIPGFHTGEIVTPPLPEERALALFHEINAFMEDQGIQTNKSCGFHVNLSYNRGCSKLNPSLLVACTDDLYIAKRYNRQNNYYCVPWAKKVKQLNSEVKRINKKNSRWYSEYNLKTEFDMLVKGMIFERFADNTPHGNVLLHWEHSDKYLSVNISKLPEQHYVEYRMIGGKDYHKDPDAILEAIEHFKAGQTIAHENKQVQRIDQYLDWAVKR